MSAFSRPAPHCCPRPLDEVGEAVEVGARERVGAVVEERGDGTRRGVVEERRDEVPEGRPRGRLARDGCAVDVPRAVDGVDGVALVLENPEVRPDRRVARRVREGRLDVGDGRRAEAVEDVEDLPLAAAERGDHAD